MGNSLSYNFNGGNGTPPNTINGIKIGDLITVPTPPIHPDGYSFLGWDDQQEPFDLITGTSFYWQYSINITLKAVWGYRYSLTYNFNNEITMDLTVNGIEQNQLITLPLPTSLLHLDGYSFLGWYDQQLPLQSTILITGTNFRWNYTKNITFKALWGINSNFAIPSGKPVKFSQIQKVFGGTNPIKISEYYNNISNSYTGGIAGIPSTTNPINMRSFYGKYCLPIIRSNNTYVTHDILNTFDYVVMFISPTDANTIAFNYDTVCEVLLVGGGGRGTSGGTGGGGGGGVVHNIMYNFTAANTYTIAVGSGGVSVNAVFNGSSGNPTSISSITGTITAPGGTGGYYQSPYNGGNSSYKLSYDIIDYATMNYIGGTGYTTTGVLNGGGGAGAVGNGGNASSASGGLGGEGYISNISGSSMTFARGGAGGKLYISPSVVNNSLPIANTSIGGGGTGGNYNAGLIGNDGCVIIKFKIHCNFTSMTFTPAGAIGNTGPVLNTLISNYCEIYPLYTSWIYSDLTYFNSNNGKQILRIQKTGTYKITAVGAGAVSGKKGYGHYITKELTSNEYLTLIVGQKGIYGNGGGGSFVFISLDITNLNNLLICAGGAGGYGSDAYSTSATSGGNGGTGGGCATSSGGTGGTINTNGNDGSNGIDAGQGVSQYTAAGKGGKGGNKGSPWNNAGLSGAYIGSFGGGGLAGIEGANGWYSYGGQGGGGGGGGYDGGGGGGGGGGGNGCNGGGGGRGGGGSGGSFPTSGTTAVTITAEADGYISIEFLS